MRTSAQHLALARVDFGEVGELGSLCCLVKGKSLPLFSSAHQFRQSLTLPCTGRMRWVLLSEGCDSSSKMGLLVQRALSFSQHLNFEVE